MGEGEGADGWGRDVSERGPRARESGEALTGGARRSVGGSGAQFGPPGPEERGGLWARASWAEIQPSRRRGEGFPFSFLILFLFLFLFYSCVFCFFFS
jgi:glycine/D-amino acid oxidase-like deaminating enzyme